MKERTWPNSEGFNTVERNFPKRTLCTETYIKLEVTVSMHKKGAYL
jgi:hypothetical protein